VGDELKGPDELDLLRRLRDGPTGPDDASVARARALLDERIAGSSQQQHRPRAARKRLLIAAAALAIGGVVGFGVAGSFAPSGSASSLGFGFLPEDGWAVVQSGAPDAEGVARAIAANVPIDPRDVASIEPRATIRGLPNRGVVMAATFWPQGDAQVDAGFPARQPPLLLENAERVGGQHWQIRAGIRGYNVMLTLDFGMPEPSERLWAAAQRQLDRLLVAADRVTIFVQPSVVSNPRNRSIRLYGSIDSDKANESIAIQAKDCGSDAFRLVAGATSESGGAWSTLYWPAANTTVRAVWNDVASPQIAVRVRVYVGLYKRRDGKSLRVVASGIDNFWRKRVEIQRFERRLGTWRRLRTVVLSDSGGNRGSGPNTGQSGSLADFAPRVPRGTLLRAVMPSSQAKPCYLAGTSATLRW
jgi:hypothetical protein